MGDQLSEEDRTTFTEAIEEGRIAEATVVRYCDWLISTWNVDHHGDGNEWVQPERNPCAKDFAEYEDFDDEDYGQLGNMVERHMCDARWVKIPSTLVPPTLPTHTLLSLNIFRLALSRYCLRPPRGARNARPVCRFGYPQDLKEETRLEFEELKGGGVRIKLVTRRNDPLMNSHCRIQLQGWRANVDIQLILDKEAAVNYMVKYASKPEKRSDDAGEIFSSVMAAEHGDTAHRWRRLMLKCVGNRDMGAQEIAHCILQLPMCRPGFEFAVLSLDGSRQIQLDDPNQAAFNKNIVDMYANRRQSAEAFTDVGDIRQMSLVAFAQVFDVKRQRLVKRAHKAVVRSYPQLPSDPEDPNYGQYCKYMLIKFKPWEGAPCNAWGGDEDGHPVDEVFINAWNAFVESEVSIYTILRSTPPILCMKSSRSSLHSFVCM